jgi:hypothetical protein
MLSLKFCLSHRPFSANSADRASMINSREKTVVAEKKRFTARDS